MLLRIRPCRRRRCLKYLSWGGCRAIRDSAQRVLHPGGRAVFGAGAAVKSVGKVVLAYMPVICFGRIPQALIRAHYTNGANRFALSIADFREVFGVAVAGMVGQREMTWRDLPPTATQKCYGLLTVSHLCLICARFASLKLEIIRCHFGNNEKSHRISVVFKAYCDQSGGRLSMKALMPSRVSRSNMF